MLKWKAERLVDKSREALDSMVARQYKSMDDVANISQEDIDNMKDAKELFNVLADYITSQAEKIDKMSNKLDDMNERLLAMNDKLKEK